ncbi:MAG: hypothetical protein AAGD04_16645 [Pseudomonadota bacterium]
MSSDRSFAFLKGLKSGALWGIAVALSATFATPAAASTLGFKLSINDPVFNSTSGNFNVPDFQLENTSDSGQQITNFSLSIGDTSYNFDFVRIQTVFNDPGADLNYTLETVGLTNNGIGDDELRYSFTGFDAGDIFRFEVDVDPDSGAPSQDFRDILFPTAELRVTYDTGHILSQTLTTPNPNATNYQLGQTLAVPLPGGLALLGGAGGLSLVLSRSSRRKTARMR